MTAGTIMHRSHLPLKTWLMAVHIVTSHSNGISALQLQAQLGLGSYKSAWLLLHKLRRAMVDPDRSLLEDLVEIDEATLPFRTVKDPTTGGQGRSRQGKMRIPGAVELSPEGEPRRIRLAPIGDFSARSLHAFVAGTSAPGARHHRWLERLSWPARPDQGPSSVQRPPIRADLDPSCVLEPEALGARNLPWPAPRPSAPLSRRVRVPLEPPPPHRNGLRHPARHPRAPPTPTTATSSTNPGRPGASHRPPSDASIGAEYRSCLPGNRNQLPQSKSSRTSPGTVRKWNVEGRNIWCDRKRSPSSHMPFENKIPIS